jgi:hypothetical protein
MPVFEGHLELCDEGESVPVEGPLPYPSESPSIPPVSQCDAQDRVVPEESMHVVRAIAESPLVAAPTWTQHVIAHRNSIEKGFEDAEARKMELRFEHGAVTFRKGKATTKER